METLDSHAIDAVTACLLVLAVPAAWRHWRRRGRPHGRVAAPRQPLSRHLPLNLRLAAALAAELSGWAAEEWRGWRARRSRRC